AEGAVLTPVAGTASGRRASDRLPSAATFEPLGDVLVVGEVVEGALGRSLGGDRRGELHLGHDRDEDMRVVTWDGGRVSTRAAVDAGRPLTGAQMRNAFVEAVRRLTLGLVGVRDHSLVLGPIELLRFVAPSVPRNAAAWPIEG